jgi:N-acyl-D-amino-acid deacylase
MHEVGYDDVRASPEQLRRMQELVRLEMRAGALGIGSSLIYAPGNFANTDELVALTAAAAESGGSGSGLATIWIFMNCDLPDCAA